MICDATPIIVRSDAPGWPHGWWPGPVPAPAQLAPPMVPVQTWPSLSLPLQPSACPALEPADPRRVTAWTRPLNELLEHAFTAGPVRHLSLAACPDRVTLAYARELRYVDALWDLVTLTVHGATTDAAALVDLMDAFGQRLIIVFY